MTDYSKKKKSLQMPRLPLEGSIDLTYRCNNNCRHCWLRIPVGAIEKEKELNLEEIKNIVQDARAMGCRSWSLSGGEPMLRSDFAEIFEYITAKSTTYSLNTNATFITPAIAKLMKRKGNKMVVIYGATAEVHDHVTRNPGSFEAAMQGFAYLKEAGVGFTVQIIPMKDNYHQFQAMLDLAKTLSPRYRIGAAWLYYSACGEVHKNREIQEQRLPPETVVELDKPDVTYDDQIQVGSDHHYAPKKDVKNIFGQCIDGRRDFHVDPYGFMSFCSFLKDPEFRYDLRAGSFQECWDEFIPALGQREYEGKEYQENCGSCELKNDCRWCPVYGYLEHGRFSAKVDYLCAAAKNVREYKEDWKMKHCRYYSIADITIKVEADLPIADDTFDPKFQPFAVEKPGKDLISIRHHFELPEMDDDLGKEMYRKPPWAIYKKGDSWVYLGISAQTGNRPYHRVAVFNKDHTKVRVYNPNQDIFKKGGLHSLTMFATDQILLARILADREGCFVHSSGVKFSDRGLLFVGHSDAGKSTMVNMWKDKAEILCDDRIIVRRHDTEFKIHGTWSHGDVPDVSGASAPLHEVFILEQAPTNEIVPITNKKEAINKILACLIKPFVTVDWWEKTLAFIEKLVQEVPFYSLKFDKSGSIVERLEAFTRDHS